MPVSESMVQEIVQQVMAKMQNSRRSGRKTAWRI